jgi:hypothetical protein
MDPPFPTDLPPEPIPGYRLVRPLGRGHFVEVWEAIAPGGFSVALKFVSLDGRVGQLEQRALEIIKGVRHANLVAVFGAWQVAGRLVIAMELADRTLLDRLREATRQGQTGIPGAELLEYMREAAKGVDYLNEPLHTGEGLERVGIQHRDIKPQNLLLVGGSVKVADFGLARLLEHHITGHSGGLTPAYAAPEFFQGRTASQSDQYSLAVAYCQLRGGRLPFTGNAAALMAGHLAQDPDLTMLPPPEREVMARALAKDPGLRWPSCQELVRTLAALGSQEQSPPPLPAGLVPDTGPEPGGWSPSRLVANPDQTNPGGRPPGAEQPPVRMGALGSVLASCTMILCAVVGLVLAADVPRDMGRTAPLNPRTLTIMACFASLLLAGVGGLNWVARIHPNQTVRRCACLFLTVLTLAVATLAAADTLGTLIRLREEWLVDWALPVYPWALAPYAVLVLVSAWASKKVASASLALLGVLAVAALGFFGYMLISHAIAAYLLPGVLLGVCGLLTVITRRSIRFRT